MLTFSKTLAGMLLALLSLTNLQAQDDQIYITVTTVYFDMDNEDGSEEEWIALEKEFHEKVTMKNDLILKTVFLNHYFTADNSEAKLVRTFKNWADIEAFGEKNSELIEAAWPDSLAREAFLKKRDAYYMPKHSDEILVSMDGAKFMSETPTESMIYLIQIRRFDYPDDGSTEDFKSLMKEYNDAVIQANPFIKAYFPERHRWGADSRDFVNVFVLSSFDDIEKMFDKNTELINANWPDEEKRKAYFKKSGRYFTGHHADYIFASVPELNK
jgi:beta-galactosidase beta subunit